MRWLTVLLIATVLFDGVGMMIFAFAGNWSLATFWGVLTAINLNSLQHWVMRK